MPALRGERTGRSGREAASWLAKLKAPILRQTDVAAFRRWRTQPGNDQAFERARETWRRAGELQSDPEITALLERTLARSRRRARPGAVPALAVALAACAVIAVFVIRAASPSQSYATAVGEVSTIRLSDGSTLRLDTASRVTVRLARDTRRVALERGQAFFEVAHDASRPFIVQAGSTTVTDVGTRFDVRRAPDGPVQVVLVQGQVVVRTPALGGRALALHPGQVWSTRREEGSASAAPMEVGAATSWTSGKLLFHDTPLQEAVAESNRYTSSPLVLTPDARTRGLHVDGVFTAGDRESLANALHDLFDLQVDRRADGALILREPRTAPA